MISQATCRSPSGPPRRLRAATRPTKVTTTTTLLSRLSTLRKTCANASFSASPKSSATPLSVTVTRTTTGGASSSSGPVRHVSSAVTLARSASASLCVSGFHVSGGTSSVPYHAHARLPSAGNVTPSASYVYTTSANSSASASPSVTRATNAPRSSAEVGASMSRTHPLTVDSIAPPDLTAFICPLLATVLISSRTLTFRAARLSATGVLSLLNSVARTSTSQPSTAASTPVRNRNFTISRRWLTRYRASLFRRASLLLCG